MWNLAGDGMTGCDCCGLENFWGSGRGWGLYSDFSDAKFIVVIGSLEGSIKLCRLWSWLSELSWETWLGCLLAARGKTPSNPSNSYAFI